MFDREQYELRIVERKLARAKRDEFQLIIQRCNQIGFNYVVKKIQPARICFGSSIEREVLPLKGKLFHSFVGRITGRINSKKVSPAYYDLRNQSATTKLLNKKVNVKGFGSLALRLPRFKYKHYEKARKEVIIKKEIKQCYKPFGRSMTDYTDIKSITPGPGTYKEFKKRTYEKYSFGDKIQILPSVIVLCSPNNLTKCHICNTTPIGDYWRHFHKNLDICRLCMKNSKFRIENNVKNISKKIKQLSQLNEYESVRHCGFYHDHGKTTAAIRLLSVTELTHKINNENYLAKYHI